MRKSTVVVCVSAGTLLLAGCGKDPVAPVTQQDQAAGNGVSSPPSAADLNALIAGTSVSSALLVLGSQGTRPPAGNCPYDSATQMFVCLTSTIGILSSSMSYQLLDAGNRPQSAYDSTTTAAIRRVNESVTSISNTTTLGTTTLTTTTRDDRTLSGLLTELRVLSGTGSTLITMSGVAYSSTIGRVIDNVVLPGNGSRWPQSGTMTTEYSHARHTVIFNGTSNITVVIEDPTGTRTCTVNGENPTTGASCS